MAWPPVAPVNLGSAANFTVLAKTEVTTTGSSTMVGNIGLSPAAASNYAGFSQTMDSSNQFSTSTYVTGRLYAADYSPPTPAIMTSAIGDMQTAYTDAAGRAADVTGLGGGTLSGNTLVPGVYAWGTNLSITNPVFLSGGPSDVWIFQIAGTLTTSTTGNIILTGGARASNIFWQVAGDATIASIFYGNILDQTQIVLNSATVNGKLLAQSAVTFSALSHATSANGYGGPNPPAEGHTFAYPSPANGTSVNIAYSMDSPGRAFIRVYNAAGNLAASSQTGQQLAGPQSSPISLNGFAPGVYIYKVVLTYDSGRSQSLGVQKFAVNR